MWFDCTKAALKKLKIAYNNSLRRFMFLPWSNLQRCIQEVREWLRENFLLLNENKTEVVIFGKDTTEKQLQIGKSVISSISAATSLGCILDSKLNMSQHVSRVCKSTNYYLHCIRKIRNFISMDACKLLVHTLVMVRLDYCNALLCGEREDVIRQLERLQRQAARVVCKKYKNDHTSVTELMWGLHWLPIRARIQYKILLLVYKAFNNGSPTYLADMMTSCNPVRSTRSAHKVNLLVVPHQKSNKYSEKAFAVVGPRLWNELLTDELRGCNSVDTFKKKLKLCSSKTLLTFYYVLLYVLLIFRYYVEVCNSSVDGFTQHVSYFCCTID